MTPGAGWDPRDPPRICVRCAIMHYENCTGCFGFGVFAAPTVRDVPVTAVIASEAITGPTPAGCLPCPICGSTVAGIPSALL